jgi:hypothetical protein
MKEYLEKHGDAWKVKGSSDLYKHSINFLHTHWGTISNGRIPPFFPGPQPVSIERKHFKILNSKQYVVCEKTDGVRNCLMCFKFNDKKVALLINRALEITYVSVNIHPSVYEGSILDGELINDIFLVYDAILISQKNIMNLNFIDRFQNICTLLDKKVPSISKNLKVSYKQFFPLHDFKIFLDSHLPNVPYKTDGIILTPVDEPIKIGTHETLFKWKPLEKNTIDFQLKYINKTWKLFLQEKGVLIYESEIPHEFESNWFKEDMIVECMYITWEEPMWWKPVGVRTDKTHPNNRRTFYRTLVNIRENIEIKEFLDLNICT